LEAAAGEPLVIALDGVHRADPVTLMALRAVPPRFAAQPICWLLARRPGTGDVELQRTINRLRDAGASTIRLEPIRDPRRAPGSGGARALAPARAAVAP
jgi:predicted ATPase